VWRSNGRPSRTDAGSSVPAWWLGPKSLSSSRVTRSNVTCCSGEAASLVGSEPERLVLCPASATPTRSRPCNVSIRSGSGRAQQKKARCPSPVSHGWGRRSRRWGTAHNPLTSGAHNADQRTRVIAPCVGHSTQAGGRRPVRSRSSASANVSAASVSSRTRQQLPAVEHGEHGLRTRTSGAVSAQWRFQSATPSSGTVQATPYHHFALRAVHR